MSARRAAHHIGHLLRAERVAAASSWYRNTDAGDAPRLIEPLSQPLHLILDNVRSAYNVWNWYTRRPAKFGSFLVILDNK